MEVATRKPPPRKQFGQGRGPRRIDGALLDVRGGSIFFGWSEKKTRGMVQRRLVPFHKLGGRIMFLRAELEAWLPTVEGCSLAEATANMEARRT